MVQLPRKKKAIEIYEREMARVRVVASVLVATIVAFIVSIPHVLKGHSVLGVALAEDYEQSIGILFLSLIALAVFSEYRKRKMHVLQRVEELEHQLAHSYSYIGEANNRFDLIQKFLRDTEQTVANRKEFDALFETLLAYMVVSVAKSGAGAIFFVDTKSAEVVREYRLNRSKKNVEFPLFDKKFLKISNGEIRLEGTAFYVLKSEAINDRQCVLYYEKNANADDASTDRELLEVLLHHALMTFLVKKDF